MPSTPILLRAEKAWPADDAAPELRLLRRAWADRHGASPCPEPFAAWHQAMSVDDGGALEAIACVRDAALLACEARGGVPPKTAEFVVAQLLLAFERHVQWHAGADADAAELGERLRAVDEPLAAQVVSACLSGQGLLLMSSGEGAEPEAEPANVISGLPPEVLLQRDGAAAVRLEVDAALQAMRQVPATGSLAQRRAAARQRQRDPRTAAAIARDVRAFAARWNTGLMFVVPEVHAPEALRDAEVCAHARDELGVGVYRFGRAGDGASGAVDDAAWSGVVADIAQPLREAIAVLFPRAAPARLAGPSATAPQVFLSYAHAEQDRPWVERVHGTLQALEENGHITLWKDSRDLRTGEAFHPEIQAAIDASRIAVVLVSTALLKSDYVLRHELPHILRRRDAAGLTFCPLMLLDCDHGQHAALAETNFRFGTKALASLQAPGEGDELLSRLSHWLREHLTGKAR